MFREALVCSTSLAAGQKKKKNSHHLINPKKKKKKKQVRLHGRGRGPPHRVGHEDRSASPAGCRQGRRRRRRNGGDPSPSPCPLRPGPLRRRRRVRVAPRDRGRGPLFARGAGGAVGGAAAGGAPGVAGEAGAARRGREHAVGGVLRARSRRRAGRRRRGRRRDGGEGLDDVCFAAAACDRSSSLFLFLLFFPFASPRRLGRRGRGDPPGRRRHGQGRDREEQRERKRGRERGTFFSLLLSGPGPPAVARASYGGEGPSRGGSPEKAAFFFVAAFVPSPGQDQQHPRSDKGQQRKQRQQRQQQRRFRQRRRRRFRRRRLRRRLRRPRHLQARARAAPPRRQRRRDRLEGRRDDHQARGQGDRGLVKTWEISFCKIGQRGFFLYKTLSQRIFFFFSIFDFSLLCVFFFFSSLFSFYLVFPPFSSFRGCL